MGWCTSAAVVETSGGLETKLTSLPLILFPYSHISARDLERVCVHFDRLIIYQPWFMSDPVPSHQTGNTASVHVFYPPVHRKPKTGFKALLLEYRQWIRRNQDRSYSAFLQSLQDGALSEKARWEIGKMLRRMNEDDSRQMENRDIKWHLILHLAREIVENRCEEGEMLRELKQKQSPLGEALGEEVPSGSLFENFPHSPIHPFLDDSHLQQVLEAWFGLFGGLLPDRARLITLHPQVVDHVTDMIKDNADLYSNEALESMAPEPAAGRSNLSLHQLPQLKSGGDPASDFMLTTLSEKTIILLGED